MPALALGVLGFVLAACSSGSEGVAAQGSLTVFAASSLTEVFTEIGRSFELANPGVTVRFSFAGSGDLATQIAQGAPADVFASADASSMSRLLNDAGVAGEPRVIAKNSLEIITEAGNPKSVAALSDLARDDLIVVLCATSVPCGKLAAQALATAGVSVTPKSYEDRVKGVVTKVTIGEADAGIVFVTDVLAAGDSATGVSIAPELNVETNYPIVVTRNAANATVARDFVAYVAGSAGQAILATFGFRAP